MDDKLTRIAIVNADKCKPKKCSQECKKGCPVVQMGKLCIEVVPSSKVAVVAESLCIGCGNCVRRCPFEALTIINLPKSLSTQTTHRFGPNSFKLHRLPTPRPGQVLGLVGTNGIGKSTALKILAGKLQPNLGRFDVPPDHKELLTYFRGSELQSYLGKVLNGGFKAALKPQYVDHVAKLITGRTVGDVVAEHDQVGRREEILRDMDLDNVVDRNVQDLSGGELQRFCIAATCIRQADIYMFDEPSSYLDVKQRLKAAQVIRSLLRPEVYVVVVEHDLSVLDYLSDFVCCLYGQPGAYGVVTMPFSVREGINIFLAGFVPTENLRFRDFELNFRVKDNDDDGDVQQIEHHHRFSYPHMTKTMGDFTLEVDAGGFTDSEIIVLLGQNGTGKTTLIRLLAGLIKPDPVGVGGVGGVGDVALPELGVSYKPQKISPTFTGTVRQLLHNKITDAYIHPYFISEVMRPMQIDPLMDQMVTNLSGGELQRVAIVMCLGKAADIYLLDEPSAYLDSEQRIVASRVIKRFILHSKKTAFVVEHDFIMATYLADRVICYDGTPAVRCTARSPQGLVSGMNYFLASLNITFRRDPSNFRPRINKLDSVKDKEQKRAGNYFLIDDMDTQ